MYKFIMNLFFMGLSFAYILVMFFSSSLSSTKCS